MFYFDCTMLMPTHLYIFPSFPSFLPSFLPSVTRSPAEANGPRGLSMYITYISVSKSTPLAVTGPHGQLASSFIYHKLFLHFELFWRKCQQKQWQEQETSANLYNGDCWAKRFFISLLSEYNLFHYMYTPQLGLLNIKRQITVICYKVPLQD